MAKVIKNIYGIKPSRSPMMQHLFKLNKLKGFCLISVWLAVTGQSDAASVIWFGPQNAGNSNANWPATTTGTYTQNFGVAFTTGSSGTFSMDWATIGLNSSAVTGGGTASLSIALRNTTNSTAYSAVAGTSSFALDVVSFTLPATTATNFTLNLTAADIPNISSYEMSPNTSYALVLYAPSSNIGLQRTTGFASGTTNSQYTVNSGFTALSTFRNNNNYSNNANSFPSLAISFGENSIPEPTSVFLSAFAGGAMLMRRKR